MTTLSMPMAHSPSAPEAERLSQASLARVTQVSLAALLRHVVLWSSGSPVTMATVEVHSSPRGAPSPRGYDDPTVYRRTSPVAFLVAVQLTSLLRHVVVKDPRGNALSIEGFSFRDQTRWQEPSPPDPNELLQYVAGPCRIACSFCYLKGNPPALRRIHTRIPDDEFAHRLKLFRRGERIFAKSILSTDEQTTSLRLIPALETVRATTNAPVFVETNGVALTARMVRKLSEYRPIFVNVSVNSLDPVIRRTLMRDVAPERVHTALELLREAQVPFSVSIVPWHEIPLDDVEATICRAAQHGAGHIRLRLPGHTSFFSHTPLFDLDVLWSEIVDRARVLRPQIPCPILVEPGKYEHLRHVERWELPAVLGVVESSPAFRAGVRAGDYVTAVNGVPMFWRSDGIKALVRLMVNRRDVTLSLLRSGARRECHLPFTDHDAYPYMQSDHRSPYGLFLCDDIDRDAMGMLRDLLTVSKARRPVLVTSRLMERSTAMLLAMYRINEEFPGLRVAVIPNAYFGGNIIMGDLLVTDDVIRFLVGTESTGARPDLVILPSSAFNEWGRDLAGHSYRRIQHRTGVPVSLLYTRMITQ